MSSTRGQRGHVQEVVVEGLVKVHDDNLEGTLDEAFVPQSSDSLCAVGDTLIDEPPSPPETKPLASAIDVATQVFVCAECKVIFKSRDNCADHLRDVHQLHNFNFSDVDLDLLESKKTIVQRRKVTSPFRFSDESGTIVPKKFQVTKDSPLYRCSLCPSTFDTPEVSHFHIECHIEDDKSGFICRICQGQDTGSDSRVTRIDTWAKCAWHLWKVHQIDCELLSCSQPECEFKSTSSHKIREHESIHGSSRKFKCTLCHKAFKQLKQLRTHEKYHIQKNTKLPPPAESRWYTTQKCEICSRVLSDSKCLKKHIAVVHNRLKPHMCNICGHQSARKAELLLHMRTHTREKPYKCTVCTFATGDHNSLRRHLLTHSSQPKPYACPLCPFTSIQSAGFKKHVIAAHSEEDTLEALFVCPHCPRISVNKDTYEQHMRDHDQGRIPVLDMLAPTHKDTPKKSQKSPIPFLHIDDSSSNSNTSGAGGGGGARVVPYWNRDDDSSVDMVVDTGGITIPAKPPTPTPSE